MAQVLPEIDERLREFIDKQPVFFVASAPLAGDGHVNVSPKGLDTFRVLDPGRVAYLDLTGSGNETAAHLGENGRITFMFCAFEGPPMILRLFGRGRVVRPSSEEWDALARGFPSIRGARQIVVADLHRVQTSCGFAVPLMGDATDRDTLVRWAEAKTDEELVAYREAKNATSIDGIPVRTD